MNKKQFKKHYKGMSQNDLIEVLFVAAIRLNNAKLILSSGDLLTNEDKIKKALDLLMNKNNPNEYGAVQAGVNEVIKQIVEGVLLNVKLLGIPKSFNINDVIQWLVNEINETGDRWTYITVVDGVLVNLPSDKDEVMFQQGDETLKGRYREIEDSCYFCEYAQKEDTRNFTPEFVLRWALCSLSEGVKIILVDVLPESAS